MYAPNLSGVILVLGRVALPTKDALPRATPNASLLFALGVLAVMGC